MDFSREIVLKWNMKYKTSQRPSLLDAGYSTMLLMFGQTSFGMWLESISCEYDINLNSLEVMLCENILGL